ncbi:hypothetical protein AeRB84_019797 [Aphanomyces euteiches]|nr:hypothetical protein AeRB84_019797 [Aphanomyces euteiches]
MVQCGARVKIESFEFIPGRIVVRAGHSITWTHRNPWATTHSINSEDGLFESPELMHGEQFTQEFHKPGTYRYYCHRNSFMSATITVLAAQQPKKLPMKATMAAPPLGQTRNEPHRMTTFDAFVHAASLNQTSVVQRWIDKGHDVDHEDSDHHRALCVAAQNQCLETMALLVQYGADVNQTEVGGRTPLHCACAWGKLEATNFLIEHGADVDAKDANGQAPLHLACQNGDPKLVQILFAARADPYVADEHRRIPHDIASDWKRLEAMTELQNYCEHGYRQHMEQRFVLAMQGVKRGLPPGIETAIFEFLA